MKTYKKLLILSFFFVFISNSIHAVPTIIPLNPSGNIMLKSTESGIDTIGWSKVWIINVPKNTPIKLNYTIYSYDSFIISTYDDGVETVKVRIDVNRTVEERSLTVIAPNGEIKVNCFDGRAGIVSDTIFTLNYSIDSAYVINEQTNYYKKNFIVGDSLGIGTATPAERLDVNGNAIVNGKLGVGKNYLTAGRKFDIFNTTENTSLYSLVNKSTTSTVYGMYSTATNASGPVYGLYATASGGGTSNKRWAGYFNGDVEVNSGNLKVTKPAASGQYINLTRTGNNPWSIGTVYNTNTFAIGQSTATDASFTAPAFNIAQDGSVGIGTTLFESKLTVGGTIKSINGIYPWDNLVMWSDGENGYIQANGDENGLHIKSNTGNKIIMDSKVGIGISNITTDALLTVNGAIHAKEVRVNLTGLADFVFDDNYKLMPLHQVEQFVKTNNHLPEIPSATEVSKNGLNMGEMQNKLLQKIEELTLYAIEQQKMINAQSIQINAQSTQISEQNAKIEKLEKRMK